MQDLFLFTDVHGEVAAAVGTAGAAAIVALWRRAQVLQDRQTARDDANLQRVLDTVNRVTEALDANTAAIKEALRAS